MSPAAKTGNGNAQQGRTATDLLYREVRRGGKVVVLFRGIASESGVTVEARVYPVDADSKDVRHVDRPFPFPTLDQAQSFVDDSIVALEYLGCSATD